MNSWAGEVLTDDRFVDATNPQVGKMNEVDRIARAEIARRLENC